MPAGPLPPLLHPTTSLADAVRGGSLGIGYAGGGFLFFYYIGVSKVLQQLGIVTPGRVKTAGASAGVLAQGVDLPGMPPHDYWIEQGIEFNKWCLAHRNCIWTLDERYAQLVEKMVPSNAAELADGRSCSVFTWYNNGKPKPDYVCNYHNRTDVVESLRTGVYVPGWSAPEKFTYYKGKPAYDGAFEQLLPCPPNITYCIKVAGLPPWDAGRSLAAMANPAELTESVRLTLSTLDGVTGPNPLETMQLADDKDTIRTLNIPAWVGLLAEAQKNVADITPGKWRRSPMSPAQLLIHVFTPPDEAQTRMLYRMGQDDARAWALAQGWPGLRRRGSA